MRTQAEKELKITYGFEIEGKFNQELIENLRRSGWNTETCRDGSVEFSDWELECLEDYNEDVDEIKMGVFKSYETLLTFLKMFDQENYISNETCGLHIHIKIGNPLYRSVFDDYKFMKKMSKWFATNGCEHIKERTKIPQNHYCKQYAIANFASYFAYWHAKDKYRLIRNHPQGTFEFRIFSACQHKVENVKKFMAWFLDEIFKVETVKNQSVELKTAEEKVEVFNLSCKDVDYDMDNWQDQNKNWVKVK